MHLEEVLHESQRVYDIVVYRDNDIVRITLQSPVILVMRLEVSIAPSDVHPRPSQFIKLGRLSFGRLGELLFRQPKLNNVRHHRLPEYRLDHLGQR